MTTATRRPERTGWAVFAAIMLALDGVGALAWGIVALVTKGALPAEGQTFSAMTFWGWVTIAWALLALSASHRLLRGTPSAFAWGGVAAALSAVLWMFALPTVPLLSLIAIATDVVILYGLAIHEDDPRLR